jgi:hypothetical protein
MHLGVVVARPLIDNWARSVLFVIAVAGSWHGYGRKASRKFTAVCISASATCVGSWQHHSRFRSP